jgi:undecaprenyl-diphosphatase
VPYPIDDSLFRLLYAPHVHAVTTAAVVFSALGSGWSLFAIAPMVAVRRVRAFFAWLLGALAVTGIAVFAFKAALERGRPFTVYTSISPAIVGSPTDYSLPSGHAAGSFCFALFVMVALLTRPAPPSPRAVGAALAALVFAVCVALSRVVLGFHFPTDVLAGAALGGTIGALAARQFLRRTA